MSSVVQLLLGPTGLRRGVRNGKFLARDLSYLGDPHARTVATVDRDLISASGLTEPKGEGPTQATTVLHGSSNCARLQRDR